MLVYRLNIDIETYLSDCVDDDYYEQTAKF